MRKQVAWRYTCDLGKDLGQEWLGDVKIAEVDLPATASLIVGSQVTLTAAIVHGDVRGEVDRVTAAGVVFATLAYSWPRHRESLGELTPRRTRATMSRLSLGSAGSRCDSGAAPQLLSLTTAAGGHCPWTGRRGR